MRGKEASRKLRGTLKGITPAYAGKRAKRGRLAAGRWDHPRVCGEKPLFMCTGFPTWGSPPRMRGKVSPRRCCTCRLGITPAYAGKRARRRRSRRGCRDHPRVCGEKVTPYLRASSGWGSPPRMRGKAPDAADGSCGTGITPAYAGKSVRRRATLGGSWDHPRVCGEKEHPHDRYGMQAGSPPRMRGKGQLR